MTTAAPPRPDVPAAADRATHKIRESNDPGSPMPAPWRLDMLTNTGGTAHTFVPDTELAGWDTVEAAITTALTGVRHRPAGRTPRGLGGR